MLLKHVRPRAHRSLKLDEVKLGQVIMANYNLEDPEERGHWFDCKVSTVQYIRQYSSSIFIMLDMVNYLFLIFLHCAVLSHKVYCMT